jgi:predicted nucleic acid-binding protein
VISIGAAWDQVQAWLRCDAVWIPLPTARHAALLGDFLRVPGLRANDVPDAHLAALAISHGLILCSADAGFARFPGLRWINPLAG